MYTSQGSRIHKDITSDSHNNRKDITIYSSLDRSTRYFKIEITVRPVLYRYQALKIARQEDKNDFQTKNVAYHV